MAVRQVSFFQDGQIESGSSNLVEVFHELEQHPNAMLWIELDSPNDTELEQIDRHLGLHRLVLEDLRQAQQRPKIERYDDHKFTVLWRATFNEATGEVTLQELHIVTTTEVVVTATFDSAIEFDAVKSRIAQHPRALQLGPGVVLAGILDEVVDEFEPIVEQLAALGDRIELDVFNGEHGVSRRTYDLLRQVIAFQRAAEPLTSILDRLTARLAVNGIEKELRRDLRDISDHVIAVNDRLNNMRALIESIVTVNSTLVAQRQNDDMKKISSWAAIFFAPTLISGIYGMNFIVMPETAWRFGYPFALLLMVLGSVLLYMLFKRRGWL